MHLGDVMGLYAEWISLGTLVFTIITTICTLFISFIALQHSARPRIQARLLTEDKVQTGIEAIFLFEVTNIGQWYAKPPAINVLVYFNFDPAFEPIELLYGSAQEISNKHVRMGKGGMKFLRAKEIKLSYGGEAERLQVTTRTPQRGGLYRLRISAFSENGASFNRDYHIRVREVQPENYVAV
jgi:hypothetical protein